MSIIVDKDTLSSGLRWLTTVATPPIGAPPEMHGLTMIAEDGTLTFAAHNYEAEATVSVPFTGEADEQAIVATGRFTAIARALPGDLVEIAFDRNEVTAASEGATFRFPTLPHENAGPNLKLADAAWSSVPGDWLAEVIPAGTALINPLGDKAFLHGVHIFRRDGLLSVEGGRPEALYRRSVNSPGPDFNALLPRPIAAALADCDGPVQVAAEGGVFGMNDGMRALWAGQLAGHDTYPDLSPMPRTVDDGADLNITISPWALKEAMSLAALAGDPKATPRVRVEVGTDGLMVGGANVDASGKIEVAAKVEGEGRTITVNPRIFLDAMRTIDGHEITIRARSGSLPILLLPPEGPDWALVMAVAT